MGYCLIFLNYCKYKSSLFYFKFFANNLRDKDFDDPGAPMINKGNFVLMQTKQAYRFYFKESFKAIGLSQLIFNLEQKSDY